MFSTTPTANVADGVQGNPYTVQQIINAVTSSFVVAIDVNTAAGLERLQFFEVIDIHNGVQTTIDSFGTLNGAGTLIGNVSNNGNGFADWTLGTIDLSSLPTTDGILFHAQWNNASDGGESFFLVSSSAVPEPATWGMMLLGFVGLGFAFRQSRRKVSFA